MYTDFIESTKVPKEGLAVAIEVDEGAAPSNDHAVLGKRFSVEHVVRYEG